VSGSNQLDGEQRTVGGAEYQNSVGGRHRSLGKIKRGESDRASEDAQRTPIGP
jgi:hypothetical protein